MSQLFTLAGSQPRHPAVERWLAEHPGALGAIAKHWIEVIRRCGDDVRELVHDGRPTACVGGAAFAYVEAHRAHVTVGFFRGVALPDPARLLEGTGRFMRHVKLTVTDPVDGTALADLIYAAHADIRLEVVPDTDGDA